MATAKGASRRAAAVGLGEKGTKARAQLLVAAGSILAEHGWEGATSRRIALSAALNLSLIRYYYGGLDTLLLAAVAEATRQLEALLAPAVASGDVVALLEQVLVLFRCPCGSEPHRLLRILSEATLKAARDKSVAVEIRGFLLAFRGQLTSVVRASLTPSLGRDPAAVAAGAALLAATLEGMLLHASMGLEFCVTPLTPLTAPKCASP